MSADPPFGAVLLDLDGTLIDSNDAHARAWSAALLRLERALDGSTSGDEVRNAKPFDDIFSLAIRRFRLERSNPVAVGDTPYDIAAAHQIGIRCFAVRSGGFPERTLASADRVFS